MTRTMRGWCGAGLVLVALAGAVRAQDEPPTPPAPPEAPEATTLPATLPSELPESVVGTDKTTYIAIDVGGQEEEWGRIVIELLERESPLTTAHFLRYVDDNFHAGTIFHRVIREFIVQGGQYVTPADLKQEGLRRGIRNEARNGVKNTARTVGLARTRDPHSGNAQFYFNLVDNPRLDHPGKDGFGYTVFGKVVEGWEIVERIAGVPTRRNTVQDVDNTPSLPVNPPVIRRIHRLPADYTPPPAATTAPSTTTVPATAPATRPATPDEPAPPDPQPEPIPDEQRPT